MYVILRILKDMALIVDFVTQPSLEQYALSALRRIMYDAHWNSARVLLLLLQCTKVCFEGVMSGENLFIEPKKSVVSIVMQYILWKFQKT